MRIGLPVREMIRTDTMKNSGDTRKEKHMPERKKRENPGKRFRFLSVLIVAIWLAVLCSIPVSGQSLERRELSLRAAQNLAVKYSYDSRRSQLDIQAAQKQVNETLAIGLPQVSSTIDYLNNLELATVLIPNIFQGKPDELIPVQFGTQHNASVNFSVSQLIFNGSYFVGLQASKVFRQLADQNHERTRLSVLETVTNSYHLILVTEETEQILISNISNLEKTHYEIRERYKEGFVSETDADLVQIALTKLKNNFQSITRNKEVAYKLLKYQMGLDLSEEIVLTDKLEAILKRIDLDQLRNTEFDIDQNIDYQLLQTQERLSELDLKNEKMKYFPTIAAFYAFQWNAMRNEFNFLNFDEKWYRTQIVGVSVNLPIFQSGSLKAKVQKAAVSLEQAQTAKKQAAEGLLLEAARARADLDSAHDTYVNSKNNLSLSEKVYDVTLIKYKEGVASSMDLTQAHDQFLLSQSEYIQAISALLAAKNKLDRLNNDFHISEAKDN
jgi:outer membrane protein